MRARLAKERETKKKDNERYATSIKNTKVASTKASYRKMKIDRAASYDRQIESIKKQIENAKAGLARERKNKKIGGGNRGPEKDVLPWALWFFRGLAL